MIREVTSVGEVSQKKIKLFWALQPHHIAIFPARLMSQAERNALYKARNTLQSMMDPQIDLTTQLVRYIITHHHTPLRSETDGVQMAWIYLELVDDVTLDLAYEVHREYKTTPPSLIPFLRECHRFPVQ